MTAITIDVESEFATLLGREAKLRQLSPEQLAKAWLEERMEDARAESELALSADELAGIERGLADVAAGRVVAHDTMVADLARWRDE